MSSLGQQAAIPVFSGSLDPKLFLSNDFFSYKLRQKALRRLARRRFWVMFTKEPPVGCKGFGRKGCEALGGLRGSPEKIRDGLVEPLEALRSLTGVCKKNDRLTR